MKAGRDFRARPNGIPGNGIPGNLASAKPERRNLGYHELASPRTRICAHERCYRGSITTAYAFARFVEDKDGKHDC